jgi:hypothetical protein
MKTKIAFLLVVFAAMCGAAHAQVNNARMLSTPNAQTGTTYVFVPADTTRAVTFNNAGAVAVTLPNGATFGFGAGTMLTVINLGAGTVTITCSSCTINGAGTLVITQNQGADIYGGAGSPAVNYVALPTGGGSFGGTVANQQIAVGSGPNTVTSSPNFTWTGSMLFLNNPTLATNILNQNSPTLTLQGNYWNGNASALETCTVQGTLNAGTNPQGNIVLNCTGSPGGAGVSLPSNVLITAGGGSGSAIITFTGSTSGAVALQAAPNAGSPAPSALPTLNPTTGQYLQGFSGSPNLWQWETIGTECGTVAANGTCANTTTTLWHCVTGQATLSGGTSTITGLAPSFTSATSFTVITNDSTTPGNSSKGAGASSSSITFTGTGTDTLNFIACGG